MNAANGGSNLSLNIDTADAEHADGINESRRAIRQFVIFRFQNFLAVERSDDVVAFAFQFHVMDIAELPIHNALRQNGFAIELTRQN